MADNQLGSFEFDVKANIIGYEEGLEKLKKALEGLAQNTELGKTLTKQLQEVQAIIDGLSKKEIINVKSQKQLDTFYETTERLDKKMHAITEAMQGLIVGHFDSSTWSQELQQLVKDYEQLKKTADDLRSSEYLQKQIASSQELRDQLRWLNIAYQGLDDSHLQGAVTERLKQIEQQASAAQTEVDKLTEKLEKIGNQQISAGAQLSASSGARDSLLANLQSLNFNNIEKISEEKLSGLVTALNQQIKNLNIDSEPLRQKIGELLTIGLDPASVQSKLAEITNIITQTTNTTLPNALAGIAHSGSKLTFDTLFNDLVVTVQEDAKSLDAARQALSDVFSRFEGLGGNTRTQIDNTINSIIKALQAGNIEDASETIKSAFTTYQTNLATSINKLEQSYAEGAENLEKAQHRLNDVLTRKTVVQQANDSINKIMNDKSAQIKALESQIKQAGDRIDQERIKPATSAREEANKVDALLQSQFVAAQQAAAQYAAELERVKKAEQLVGKIQGLIQRWFSVYGVVRMVTKALRSMKALIEEIDKTITEIAIVTNMDQDELWSQIPKYTQMAKEFGASISGVYQVSQLYYQQGGLKYLTFPEISTII